MWIVDGTDAVDVSLPLHLQLVLQHSAFSIQHSAFSIQHLRRTEPSPSILHAGDADTG